MGPPPGPLSGTDAVPVGLAPFVRAVSPDQGTKVVSRAGSPNSRRAHPPRSLPPPPTSPPAPGARRRPQVLLSCGSFNPPTKLHLEMFSRAREALIEGGLAPGGVAGLMSPVNDAYGKPGLAPGPDRVAMCSRAAAASGLGGWVAVDPWESEQDAYQRTLVVLRRVRSALEGATEASVLSTTAGAGGGGGGGGGEPGDWARVTLLCGTDLLESFARPGVWLAEHMREILEDFGVVVCARGGVSSVPALPGSVADLAGRVVVVAMPENDVSSTAVRAALQSGDLDAARAMAEAPVLQYCVDRNLYPGA